MSDSAISIAMATCNGERFLSEQLASLARQTALPHELIVSDDASTDRTIEIVERFAKTAPFPVRVGVNAGRLGFAENFLRAASLCGGRWIAFCDQDDVWINTKLERCAEALRDESVMLVIHAGSAIDENNRLMGWRFPDVRRSMVFGRLGQDPWKDCPGFAMVFRADLPLLFSAERPWGGIDRGTRMYHDQWIRFLANIFGHTAYVADSLVLNRRHGENATDPTPVGTLASVRNAVDTGARSYRLEAALFRERAAFLEGRVTDLSPAYRAMAVDGASYFHELEARLTARSGIYQHGRSLLQRLKALAHLAIRGGYRRRTRGGLGVQSFIKDASVGVLGAHD